MNIDLNQKMYFKREALNDVKIIPMYDFFTWLDNNDCEQYAKNKINLLAYDVVFTDGKYVYQDAPEILDTKSYLCQNNDRCEIMARSRNITITKASYAVKCTIVKRMVFLNNRYVFIEEPYGVKCYINRNAKEFDLIKAREIIQMIANNKRSRCNDSMLMHNGKLRESKELEKKYGFRRF